MVNNVKSVIDKVRSTFAILPIKASQKQNHNYDNNLRKKWSFERKRLKSMGFTIPVLFSSHVFLGSL